MQARLSNPAMLVPDAMPAFRTLGTLLEKSEVPKQTLALVHLRASQVNGCSVCVVGGVQHARQAGETDERLSAVAAWRDAPYFTPAERAALALAEAITRISDSTDPVPDAVWEEAARHYDEKGLASLVIAVSVTNLWNRLNVSTRQVAGATW